MTEPVIVFENADLLVVNKPAGMLVHGMANRIGDRVKGRGYKKQGVQDMNLDVKAELNPTHSHQPSAQNLNQEPTLVDWLLKKYPEIKNVGDHSHLAGEFEQKTFDRPGIVHRLDRETSGMMTVAKNQPTFNFLKKLFQTREIHKTYLALVWGLVKLDRGLIDKVISIKNGSVKRTVGRGKMPREAVTEYEVVKRYGDGAQSVTLLRVFPKTGRTHQIRVHLNSIGHPVVGDKLYGKKKHTLGLVRHFLHAESLELPLPTGERITVAADLPAELTAVLERVQADPGDFD